MLLLPLRQRRNQQPDIFLVANEIVVHYEYRPAPTCFQEGIKFGQDLLRALGSWNATIDFDDVAKLTLEWTAA